MRTRSHSVTAEVDPSVVWEHWTNVEHWVADTPGVRVAKLNGPLAKGAIGWFQPERGPKASFRIVEVDRAKRRFVWESNLFGAKLQYVRSMERPSDKGADPNAWTLTHRIEIRGMLARMWDRLYGRHMAEQWPAVMARIVEAAAV